MLKQFRNKEGNLVYERSERDAEGNKGAELCNREKVEKRNGKEATIVQELQLERHKVRYVRTW